MGRDIDSLLVEAISALIALQQTIQRRGTTEDRKDLRNVATSLFLLDGVANKRKKKAGLSTQQVKQQVPQRHQDWTVAMEETQGV